MSLKHKGTAYPVTGCLTAKAIKNVPGARAKLREVILHNQKFGAFSVWPCECQPRCDADIDNKDLPQLMLKLLEEVPEAAIFLQ